MFGKKKDAQAPALSRYQDVTGSFSNRQLTTAEWIIHHKPLFRKIGIGVLAALAGGTMLYSLFAWSVYLIVGLPQDRAMLAAQSEEFENYARLHPKTAPRPLQTGNAAVFQSAADQYDFVTFVQNPNERFLARVQYRYIWSGGESAVQTELLLPGEERPMVLFAQRVNGTPASARLIIEETQWRRVDPHAVKDVEGYIGSRLDFIVSDVSFVRGGTDDQPAHQVSFTLQNNTIYSYWDPVFYIALYGENRLSGLLFLRVPEFKEGEAHEITIATLLPGLNVTSVTAHPVVNIFSPDVYIAPQL